MNFKELKDAAYNHNCSHDYKAKAKAVGYMDIIDTFEKERNSLESEPVMISMIAEKYLKTQEMLFNKLGKEHFRYKIQAALDCIIRYATPDEISKYFISFKPEDKSFSTYLNYARGMGYMERTKYSDLLSAYNLIML